MLKLICATIIALLVVSCDRRGSDEYAFGTKQYEKSSVKVNIVTYKSEKEFREEIKRRKLSENTAAFTVLKPPFDECTINMIDPSVRYEPQFVGHEFLHCVYGQWHTNNQSRQ